MIVFGMVVLCDEMKHYERILIGVGTKWTTWLRK